MDVAVWFNCGTMETFRLSEAESYVVNRIDLNKSDRGSCSNSCTECAGAIFREVIFTSMRCRPDIPAPSLSLKRMSWEEYR
ncbi:hypothetical protein CEXT_348331 [Caerostris extrusa]|uniref:Uncharacterized protein n=1 Tax=Caerostris extrusa TaxID=172846 RepID=A0AAV4TRR1_CAEEX|nr:hypothetical protein CEXT_348331 [Caerostris extrusa]